MKEYSYHRHYSEKGGHYFRGAARKSEIKAQKQLRKLSDRGEILPQVTNRFQGADVVFEYRRHNTL